MEAFLRLHSIQFRGNLWKFVRHAALLLPDCGEEETETQRDEAPFEAIHPGKNKQGQNPKPGLLTWMLPPAT